MPEVPEGRRFSSTAPGDSTKVRWSASANHGDPACVVATNNVCSWLYTICLLSVVKYMNDIYNKAARDDAYCARPPRSVAGLFFYRSIQPGVARANASSDEAAEAYSQTAPEDLAADLLDGALTVINQTVSGLLLTQDDLIANLERPTPAID